MVEYKCIVSRAFMSATFSVFVKDYCQAESGLFRKMAGRMETLLHGPDDTRRLAWALAPLLRRGDVLALVGPLGAGKTLFVEALFSALGARDHVRSPSFVLVNEYSARIPLYHMDLYRLESPDDLEDIGIDEYFYGDGIVAVEWADRAMSRLPHEHILIELQLVPGDESSRVARIGGPGARAGELVTEVRRVWRSLR
jgi:tRNA threonylcarbamoyladenosine biosynthesis protein TsaE